MITYEGGTRLETRQRGRTYVVETKIGEGGFLDFSVTSSAGRGRTWTELCGRIPPPDLYIVTKLLTSALALQSVSLRSEAVLSRYPEWLNYGDQSGYSDPDAYSAPPDPFSDQYSDADPSSYSDWSTGQSTSLQRRSPPTMEERRKKHPNAYKPWTEEDGERLRRRHAEGASGEDLVSEFGRGLGGIIARMTKVVLSERDSSSRLNPFSEDDVGDGTLVLGADVGIELICWETTFGMKLAS